MSNMKLWVRIIYIFKKKKQIDEMSRSARSAEDSRSCVSREIGGYTRKTKIKLQTQQ